MKYEPLMNFLKQGRKGGSFILKSIHPKRKPTTGEEVPILTDICVYPTTRLPSGGTSPHEGESKRFDPRIPPYPTSHFRLRGEAQQLRRRRRGRRAGKATPEILLAAGADGNGIQS